MTTFGKFLVVVFGLIFAISIALIGRHYQIKDCDARYSAGYRAALAGVPVEACPHSNMGRNDWLEGWIEGFKCKKRTEVDP